MRFAITGKGVCSLMETHRDAKNISFDEAHEILKSIRIGTSIEVENSNPAPEPHRGKYYLLFLQEFDMVYIFYVDVKGMLRVVYTGDNAAKGICQSIATGTVVKLLKSSNKNAYRVVRLDEEDNVLEVCPLKYKNKSSQIIPQVYLNLFEAINYASKLYKMSSRKVIYGVVTPKNTVMFKIG